MWELDYKESWVLKNWCLNCGVGGLLRVPWTTRRSNKSILKEISPEYSLETLMLKLNLQYFGHLMRRTNSFEKKPWHWKRLKAGEGDDRGWDGWMSSLTQRTWVWAWVGDGQGGLVCCSLWSHRESDMTERLSWTEFSLIYSSRTAVSPHIKWKLLVG